MSARLSSNAQEQGVGVTLETARDIRAGTTALRDLCPVMRRIHDVVGDPALRRHPPGLEGLAQIVIGQQLSTASATAIWQRFSRVAAPFDAETLLGLDDATLRAAGLSRGKVRTLRAAANAFQSGALPLDADAPDDELFDALVSVSGIGPWTADIYILFCRGRRDGFASGDLALQIAAQQAFELQTRPDPLDLTELAERWRPWRGVAAHLLWAFYAHRRASI